MTAMNSLLNSRLYDQTTFYNAFEKDLKRAHHSVLIVSPFITERRMNDLLPSLSTLRKRSVRIAVNTRCPVEYEAGYRRQAALAASAMQRLGLIVLYTGKLHRKIAIIDDEILWEGSLNTLSHSDSCEIMRRVESAQHASQAMGFIRIDKFFNAD